MVPVLQNTVGVIVTRLQDADYIIREACAEAVGWIASAVVKDGPDGPVALAALLEPLFVAFGDYSKASILGAAACFHAVLHRSSRTVVQMGLDGICSRLLPLLLRPPAMALSQVLYCCVSDMLAVGRPGFVVALPSGLAAPLRLPGAVPSGCKCCTWPLLFDKSCCKASP